MSDEAPVFTPVDPSRTTISSDVRISWTSVEDGGPTIYAWYISNLDWSPDRTSDRWSVLAFRKVLFFRYHNEHVINLQRADETWAKTTDGRPWVLRRASKSHLLSETLSNLATLDPVTGSGNWCGVSPESLSHFQLVQDHNGHYEIIAAEVDISEHWLPVGENPLAVPPFLGSDPKANWRMLVDPE